MQCNATMGDCIKKQNPNKQPDTPGDVCISSGDVRLTGTEGLELHRRLQSRSADCPFNAVSQAVNDGIVCPKNKRRQVLMKPCNERPLHAVTKLGLSGVPAACVWFVGLCCPTHFRQRRFNEAIT